MADPTDDPESPSGDVTREALASALGERYLTYALSTITHRALPDARDGLKPVHRRILYAMRGLRLDPGSAFRKCAKIVGEVMGNYHPHGDQAIYDALARLAQDFNVRYPLVDGQGNFGNIDGDNPAAQRYTEARLTSAAAALMEGLAEDAVDFRDNYDGSEREPVVLPAAFPNLLANGSSGIAVGMATNIPPHNLEELCQAALHLVKYPGASDEKLLDFVQGPDFPTGGVIVEPRANIKEAYRTGRGGFRLRARWAVEDLGRGQWQVVVTEIPYQVQKGKLIERIADLINAKKIPILADVRDESAEDLRIVLEPRARTVDPAVMMEMLFKTSDLETRFAMNMNVLIDGRTPKVCSLSEVLRAFLDHRRDVLLRRSRFRLEKIEARLEILEGYLVAYLNLDRVIEIIRTEDEPKAVMMAEFGLSDAQAEAILNMRLRSLRRLEEMEIRGERDTLTIEREGLITLLGSEEAQWRRIAEELQEVRKAFGAKAPGGARRTSFDDMPDVEEVAYEAMIEREPITVVCSEMGWIRAMKGHLADDAELKFKDGDGPRFLIRAETTDRLLLLASNGRMFTLSCATLPGGRGMGEPIRLIADIPNEARMVALFVHRPGAKLIVASDAGDGFVLPEDEALAQTRAGKQVLNLRGESRAKVCRPVRGDHLAVVGENRKVLVFPVAELDEMGRGKGTRLQRYKDGGLSDAITFDLAAGLSWKDPAGRTRTVTAVDLAEWVGKRADAGRMAPRGFPQNNRFD
ncbi:MAG: DNA topoisomerase IV subunit A [Rhodovulum sulfidophilum]|uniref:DNA topoisomerase 4 subunit A n=1 Tax=Rhodovulum sulfidophilum TaxID=35806 RepID=A0A2W5PW76_RHOSU|nr:MAG: DNA topoisomerase IV subunit A [Rhodovulum sulfidophilum]